MRQARVIHHSLCDSSLCYMYWSNGVVLIWNIFCKEKNISISINEASRYTANIQKQHRVFTNVFEFSHRNCMLMSHWLSTVVMTLRCCQHKSTLHGLCREDGTVERRRHDLWPCSMDSIWLLFTVELSCVDTKWLSYFDSEESRREAVCYQANIGTQPLRVITEKTHSHQTNCVVPGLPLSPLLLSPTSFEKKKKKKWQVWIC